MPQNDSVWLKPVAIIALVAFVLLPGKAFADGRELKPDTAIAPFTADARSYALTTRGDYAKESFQAEITVTIRSGHGGNGCAYFGIGKGQRNPADYDEPTISPSLVFRLAPSDFGGGFVTSILDGVTNDDQVQLGDGTHRLRLSWDAAGKRAWLQIHPNWKPGAAFTPTLSLLVSSVPVEFGDEAHLIVGGASSVSFTDFSVRPLTDAELQKLPVSDSFAQDPSSGTWLPVEGASALAPGDALTAPVDDFLKELQGNLRPLVCWYRGGRLQASRALPGGKLDLPDSKWALAVATKPVAGAPDALDVNVSVTLKEGGALSAGIAAAFDFDRWSRDNYVLVPAVIYNGNRFHALGGGYMPAYPREMFFDPRLPLTMSNNPRLSVEPGKAGKIELLTGNAATPAICFYSPAEQRGFILLCEQRTRFGNNGLFVEENAAQDRASLVVSAPGVREMAANFGGFRPSGDTAADWLPGDSLTLKFRIYSFPVHSIPDLLAKFMTVRKAFTGPNHPRNLVPMSEMSQMIVPRFKARWLGNYYACDNNANFQLGWVSGFMQTPMLAIDDPTQRRQMCHQMDYLVAKLQGKSGYFYGGIMADGKLWADRTVDGRILVLTRKNADALVSFFKQFDILKAQGHGDLIKPEWEQSARRLAQAFVNTWNKDHEFGQYLDPQTGEIAIYNSTSGALVPAGLAMASRYFNDPEFLRVALQSAEFYYNRDVVALGMTAGHSGDTSQDPDADSTYGFLESMMAMYWATDDKAWLDKARIVADLGATWTLSYDEVFPPQSQIARMGGHMAGAVWASTQNKHAAPGICTSSGDYLFKLYRATGDVHYANLIRDIQHAQVEATDMPGHPTCGTGFGASMERIQPTDGEGKGEIGNFIHTQNAWTEMDGLMMVTELPGIYLQTDTERFYVFDSVEAKVVGRDSEGVKLEIHNPTPYDAKITVFAETAAQAAKPLSYTAYLHWPRVEVKAGETRTVHITAPADPEAR
jgi:hypothetical protein